MIKENIIDWINGVIGLKITNNEINLTNIDALIEECLSNEEASLESSIELNNLKYTFSVSLNRTDNNE